MEEGKNRKPRDKKPKPRPKALSPITRDAAKKLDPIKKSTGGQRPSLSPERQQLICQALREGHYQGTAAQLGGISYSTYQDWMRRGRVERKEGIDGIYARFEEACRLAMAEAEAEALRHVREASRGWKERTIETESGADGKVKERVTETVKRDWRAAAWFLARRHSRDWGDKASVNVEVEIPPMIVIGATPEQLKGLRELAGEAPLEIDGEVVSEERGDG